MTDYLIDVMVGEPLKQENIGDKRASRLFQYLWNEMYPKYPVSIKMNPHDFGSYPSVVISSSLFEKGLDDTETFPDGIEDTALSLVDQWNASLDSGKPLYPWSDILQGTLIEEPEPFKMAY